MNIINKNTNYYYLLRSVAQQVIIAFLFVLHHRCFIHSTCVSILKMQWLSSPHVLAQHGLSHDTLQWLKQLNGFKADSDNPILCVYIYKYILVFNKFY